MSNYADMYHRKQELVTIESHCPAWATDESHEVMLAIAEGVQAKKELFQLKNDLACLRRLLGK